VCSSLQPDPLPIGLDDVLVEVGLLASPLDARKCQLKLPASPPARQFEVFWSLSLLLLPLPAKKVGMESENDTVKDDLGGIAGVTHMPAMKSRMMEGAPTPKKTSAS
jgi:hypothetical protein